MGPTYNSLLLDLTLFSLTYFSLSFFYFPSLSFVPYFFFFFFYVFHIFFSLAFFYLWKSIIIFSFYIKEPKGALVRPRWLRDEGNDKEAKTSLVSFSFSHSLFAFPCLLPIGLDLCFPCLNRGDGKRWWWLSLPIYLCFFSFIGRH